MSDSLIRHLQDLVHGLVSPWAGVSRRKMLRSDGWFVRGSAFTLVNRDARIVVRLVEAADQDALFALPGVEGWRIGKKAPMRAWILLPEAFHDDPEALVPWLERAWKSAPAKKVKAPAKRKGRAR